MLMAEKNFYLFNKKIKFDAISNKKEFLKSIQKLFSAKNRIRQLAIFPGGLPPSSFAASSLYDRVRDGNGWDPAALSPENCRDWLTSK